MREVLVRSPSVAFAFGSNAAQSAGACAPTGPSQAAHPPAEHVGSGGTAAVTTAASRLGGEEVFVWGQSPGEVYVSPARQQHVQATVMLFPVGRMYHGTPKQDAVGKVLQNHSHLCARNRHVSTPFIPWLKPRGFLAERL